MFGDTGGEDFAFEAQGFSHIHPPQLWHVDPVITYGEFIIGQIEGLARAFLALALGIAGLTACFAPLKEVLEGRGHIHKGPFNGALGDVVGPGKLGAPQRMKLRP